MNLIHLLNKQRLYFWLFFFAFGAMAWTIAQEKPQPEKRWVRWRLIEVARKSLADSILVQLQQGVSFQKLSRKHSLHASAKEGGEIGWAALDSIDGNFKNAIASLPKGKASGILKKGTHFFVYYKINELVENDYLKWKEQKAKVDSLIDYGKVFYSSDQYLKAIAYYDSALTIAREIGDHRNEARALGGLGNAHLSLSQYPVAKAYYNSALRISRDIMDKNYEGKLLGNLASIHLLLGQSIQAIVYYDSALVIAREIGDPQGELSALGNQGIAHKLLGNFYKAIAYFDSALAIIRKTGDRANEGAMLGNLGYLYLSLAKYSQAIAYSDSSLSIARKIVNPQGEASALGNMGLAYFNLAQYTRAIKYSDSALVIAQKNGDRYSEETALGNLGMAYESLGQYARAIAYLDTALSIARTIGDRNGVGRHTGNLGNIYKSLGQYNQAISSYDSALAITREIGDQSGVAGWLGNLGVIYILLGKHSLANAYFDSALGIARNIGDPLIGEKQLGNLGIVYSSLRQYSRAVAYFDSALFVAREIGDREGEGMHLSSLGNTYLSTGDYTKAIMYVDSALAIARNTHMFEFLWNYQWQLAKLHSQMQKLKRKEVIKYYNDAVDALEGITKYLIKDTDKLSFHEDKQGLYRDFINYLFAQNESSQQQRALEISEQARARAFMELIARQFHGSEVEQKWELLAPANFQQIQKIAQRLNTSILEYFISDSSLVIWLMKPDGQLHTASMPIKRAHLDSLLDFCYLGFTQMQENDRTIQPPDFLATRNVRPVTGSLHKFDFTTSMTELYQTLFPKEIRIHLPKENGAKLVLVPHRRLSVIPIMALKDSNGHYLLEKYNCHQVPGIGVLLRTSEILEKRQKLGKIQGNEMLLFGNPKMPNWGNEVLPPLSGAETEVKAIAGKFQTGFQIGTEASERAFKNFGRNKRLLHLATHGISFDASPLESFVALASGNGEDGQLTVAEIYEMQLEADLVVLSACETGLGKISGDGVEGLARSFMASGVPSVLVSLWNVDDEATKELMLAFYDNLNKGLDKAESLRQAQLKIMRTPKWRHPKYWAAFVLYGER